MLTKFNNGIPPKGNCAPCWDTTRDSPRLLIEKGLEYGEYVYEDYTCLPLMELGRSFGHGP